MSGNAESVIVMKSSCFALRRAFSLIFQGISVFEHEETKESEE